MSIIVDQNSAANIDTPSAGSSVIFVDQSGQLSVKQSTGTSGSIPTVNASNTQVIYNDQGNLAGSSGFTFDSTTGVLAATTFSGSGANLTSLPGANVSGAVSYATTANSVAGSNVSGAVSYATTANSVAGSNVSGAVSYATTANSVAGSNVSGQVNYAAIANSVAAANISGTVASATTAGTVTTAAQPNITSVGTLSTLNVSGDIAVSGNLNVTGTLNYANVNDLVVTDPLIYVGANNAGDVIDLGLVGSYTQAANYSHTGIARNHATDTWTFFDGVTQEPTTTIDWANATYPNVKSGNFSSTGNVTAQYFLGNGALLTGIITSVSNVTNGTSNINVLSSANITMSSAGNANVVVVTGTGANVNGTLVSTGQTSLGGAPGSEGLRVATTVSAVNYVQIAGTTTGSPPTISAQGSDSTINMRYNGKGSGGHYFYNGSGYAQFVVNGGVNGVNYLQTSSALTSAGPILSAQGTDTNINVVVTPKGSGNVTTAANVLIGGLITATGNITGANLVTAGLITATGNVTGGNLTTAGLITATGNIRGANLVTPGVVSATGNVTASYFLGNGSQLTGISASTAGTVTTAAQPNITSTGTLTSVSVSGNANVGGLLSVTSNATIGGILTIYGNASVGAQFAVAGNATVTGNVSANNFVTTGTSGNITGANVIFANSVTTTGSVSFGNLVVLSGGNASANGTGIAFPATQNPSSDVNTLDDYEEGTFTPVLTADSGSGATYSGVTGKYTKIGNVVHIAYVMQLSSKGTYSGSVYLTGLPFTVEDGYYGSAEPWGVTISYIGGLSTSIYTITGWCNNASTQIQLRKLTAATTNTGSAYLDATDISNTFYVQLSATYRTA